MCIYRKRGRMNQSANNLPNVAPESDWTDRIGATVSSLCAVHCAICALLPAAFGALGVGFLLGQETEWALTLTAVAFGLGALLMGWRQHRSVLVAVCLCVGIVGLLTSRGIEMSGGHHEEHGEAHHAQEGHEDDHKVADDHEAKHADAEHGEEESDHESDHHEHGGAGHGLGAGIGVLAGLTLFFGHIFNLRALRRCREECCE